MITAKTRYAIKALCVLAMSPPGEPVLIADIAEQEGIPRKFLELILRFPAAERFERRQGARRWRVIA